jgi:hypothetical protein
MRVENVVVGEINDFRQLLAHLSGCLRRPLPQPCVQLFY